MATVTETETRMAISTTVTNRKGCDKKTAMEITIVTDITKKVTLVITGKEAP